MMKVRATQLGFYGGSRRRPGDVFDVKENELGRWMEPVETGAVADEPEKPAKVSRAKRSAPAPEPVEAVSTGDQDVI